MCRPHSEQGEPLLTRGRGEWLNASVFVISHISNNLKNRREDRGFQSLFCPNSPDPQKSQP